MNTAPPPDRSPWRGDALIAVVIVAILATAWTVQDWTALKALRLSDTDDAMRLQQVRDWLGGQAWSDLTQYRLGPPGGLAMHWSRLADLPIAAIITIFRPLAGTSQAELIAVLIWPPLLLIGQLMLIAAIMRRLGEADNARMAMIVAALAYPAIAQFMPGRIDHHGLQILLLTACVHGMVCPPERWRGMAVGAAMFASLATGLELLPMVAVIGGWVVLRWIDGERGERLAGIGAGLAVTAILGAGLVPATSPIDLCDAMNPALRIVSSTGGIGALLLGVFGGRAPLPRWMLAAALAITIAVLGATLSPACLSGPYGAVDPMLERLWLRNVSEARPITAVPFANMVGYGGLMIAGLCATLWQARAKDGGWWGIAALIATAIAVSFIQVRGAYAGAALAPAGMAMLIAHARTRGIVRLAGAWIASAGILYPVVAGAIVPPPKGETTIGQDCTSPAALAALGRLPAGRIAAPIDVGAFAIPATRHASLAAPYHRNNAGNGAMYRLFLGAGDRARGIARANGVTYVVWCARSFVELDLDRDAAPDSVARMLSAGRRPGWLHPLPPPAPGMRVFAVAETPAAAP